MAGSDKKLKTSTALVAGSLGWSASRDFESLDRCFPPKAMEGQTLFPGLCSERLEGRCCLDGGHQVAGRFHESPDHAHTARDDRERVVRQFQLARNVLARRPVRGSACEARPRSPAWDPRSHTRWALTRGQRLRSRPRSSGHSRAQQRGFVLRRGWPGAWMLPVPACARSGIWPLTFCHHSSTLFIRSGLS